MSDTIHTTLFCLIIFIVDWFVFQKCTNIRLSFSKIVGIFLILFLTNLVTTELIMVDPILLMLVSRFAMPQKRWSEHIFYGFFSIMLVEVVFRMISGVILPIITGYTINQIVSNIYLLEFSYLLIIPVAYVFNYTFGFNFSLIRFISHQKLQSWLIGMNFAMITYYLIIHFFAHLESPYQIYFREYRTLFIFIYLGMMVTVVFKLDRFAKDQLEKEVADAESARIHYLENYNNYIEQLYRDIRTIKHDSENILISLKDSIDREDMADITFIYESILQESQRQMKSLGPDLSSLNNVKESVVKSLLNVKILEAKLQKIDVYVEVPDHINKNYVDILDLVPLLSHLFDHAIITAKGSRNPFISLAFFEQDGKQFFIMENSSKMKRVDIGQLFEDNRNDEVKVGESHTRFLEILSRYPKVVFSTKSDHYRFRQFLEMGN
ncbi:histidine kinase [Streptococcus bovimastitidis]|uniref:Histidine kinase n=1 Tax=Streptococcus bovimastitidis TaxID=1856638 RepID=A0A1L8MM15_9STRE|nr:histidine kinase [Streptococcus bovimastitidis]OJF71779.1 histidine kinase [Streptococcus bovimastitidis]